MTRCTPIGAPAYIGSALVLAATLGACALDDGHPPVARIEASPTIILQHDGFQTAVTLDATTSADPVDDPTGTAPLTYRWRIRGDEFRFDSGDETSPSPIVRFRGDRPPTIELTVTDADGDHNTTQLQLKLTVRR